MKSVLYGFDEFVLDCPRYALRCRGHATKLRPKTFQTLLYLVENRDRLIEKTELLDNVWAGAIVTEGTLTHCIREIREALGDDANQPRYLRTVHRVGYQFIAPVVIMAPDQERSPADRPVEAAPGGETRVQRWPGRQKLAGYGLLALAIPLILFYAVLQRKPLLSFTERGWALITDFDDLTGEPGVAVALRMVLEQELSQSAYVNVAPMGRVFDTLQLMKRDPNTRVDETLGREICQRDGGIQVLLSGGVVRVGERYAITIRLIDPASGEAAFTLVREAREKDELLPAIRKLARDVRTRLGETPLRASEAAPGLAHATTSSLKALTYFSRSWRALEQFDWENTQRFAEEAIRIDSTFAMAYLALAYAELWQGNQRPAQNHFQRAASLAIGLSERERYFILGSAAAYGRGDIREALTNYEILAQLYPDYYWGQQNLSQVYSWLGSFQKYEEHERECLRIRPNYAINYHEFGANYFFQGKMNAAARQFERALALNPELPTELPHLLPVFRAWMDGELVAAEEKISTFLAVRDRGLLPPFRVTSRWFIARFYLFLGHPDRAIDYLRNGLDLAQGSPLAGWTRLELGLTHLAAGKPEPFARLLEQVAREEVGLARVQALGWLAIESVRERRVARAQRLQADLLREQRQMRVTLLQPPIKGELERAKHAFSSQIDGEVALVAGDTSTAVAHFERVVALVPPAQRPALSALDVRLYLVANKALAQIYERQQNWPAAISVGEAIFEKRYLTIIAPAAGEIWQDVRSSLIELRQRKPY